MLEHGGGLRRAARDYGIPLADWLDLSTGVNPHAWPVPAVAASAWARLPELDDGLEQAACEYYGVSALLPVAGSQAAIQALPRLLPKGRVGVLYPAYAEHAHAWRQAGHEVLALAPETIEARLDSLEGLVLVNPNNPTGQRFAPQTLLDWHVRLAARGGFLLLDEVFMDPTPEYSLTPFLPRPGLMVLRSLGKFFGLAGARLGFVLAEPELLTLLADYLGPWTVSGPARQVAQAALRDVAWQQQMRATLHADSQRLGDLLAQHGLRPTAGTALFQWLRTPFAQELHVQLARQGILTRLFAEPASLRFGLPGREQDWQRLALALAQISYPAQCDLAEAAL